MTFSQILKEELLVQDIFPETSKIELNAALKSIGTIEYSHLGVIIEFKTMQIKLIKRIMEILKHEYPHAILQTLVQNKKNFNKAGKQYILRIETQSLEILYDLKLIDNINLNYVIGLKGNDIKITTKEKQKFCMVMFCATGTINDPKNSQQYHLEISNPNIEYINEVKNYVKEYSINFKVTKRKSKYSLYLNKSEEIADFLKFIGSIDMLLEFEDYRITRDMMSENNRLINAEIANEVRKQTKSNEHLNYIKLAKEYGLYNIMSEKTKKVAKLRIENPDFSLQELSDFTNGEISKSNIRHHLGVIKKKVLEYEEVHK